MWKKREGGKKTEWVKYKSNFKDYWKKENIVVGIVKEICVYALPLKHIAFTSITAVVQLHLIFPLKVFHILSGSNTEVEI